MTPVVSQTVFQVRDYDLAATLNCGQAFRWEARNGAWEAALASAPCAGAVKPVAQPSPAASSRGVSPLEPTPSETLGKLAGGTPALRNAWEGVVGSRWVRLQQVPEGVAASTVGPGPLKPGPDWDWLARYLQIGADLEAVLASFPDDEPMRAAVARCHGLRLLRQEPWECLASFILSSTKQIVQIRRIIAELCARFGQLVPVPPGHPPAFAFPSAARLAACTEAELRGCKMGFRAPHLLEAARRVAGGEMQLETVAGLSLPEARHRLLRLPGVGQKIADCVLLFAFGFPDAFPIDVWMFRALRQLYFPRRRPLPARLRRFTEDHFGRHAGYAQQYLFHYIRLSAERVSR